MVGSGKSWQVRLGETRFGKVWTGKAGKVWRYEGRQG